MANYLTVIQKVTVSQPMYPDVTFNVNDSVSPSSPYYNTLFGSQYVSDSGIAAPNFKVSTPPEAMTSYGDKAINNIPVWNGTYWVPGNKLTDVALSGTVSYNGSIVLTQQDLASNPSVLTALANLAIADASIAKSFRVAYTKYFGDEGFLADEFGNLSVVGFDYKGDIADATMDSAMRKGMPRLVSDGSDGFHLTDSTGTKLYALGFDRTGQFDLTTKWALVNLLGEYTGADEPFVWPGSRVRWHKIDSSTGVTVGTYWGIGS